MLSFSFAQATTPEPAFGTRASARSKPQYACNSVKKIQGIFVVVDEVDALTRHIDKSE